MLRFDKPTARNDDGASRLYMTRSTLTVVLFATGACTGPPIAAFEDDDAEWVMQTESPHSGTNATFRTHRGEHWELDVAECIPKSTAEQLVREFSRTTKRPVSVKWRRMS